jgi:hypothetical protein
MVNKRVLRERERRVKNKIFRYRLKRRIEQVVDVAVGMLYVEMRYVFVVGVCGVFVGVQSQYRIFRRQYATEKQQQEICK